MSEEIEKNMSKQVKEWLYQEINHLERLQEAMRLIIIMIEEKENKKHE